jgi:hypothetical protein
VITAFLSVFESKLDRLKQDLKEELKRAKSDRRKDWIKTQIKEIKGLRDTVSKMKKADQKQCPHCGGLL